MKKLTELLHVQLISEPNVGIVTDNMISQWNSVNLPELSVLLVQLNYLSFLHRVHHWQTKGDPFYGDHLLFQRLYEETQNEVDVVAEKAVGLGSTENVNPQLIMSQVQMMLQGYGMSSTIPQPSELARRSLTAETNFLVTMDVLVEALKSTGVLTRGLDNMLAGMADTHEGHVYLLKQRCL